MDFLVVVFSVHTHRKGMIDSGNHCYAHQVVPRRRRESRPTHEKAHVFPVGIRIADNEIEQPPIQKRHRRSNSIFSGTTKTEQHFKINAQCHAATKRTFIFED